MDSRLALVSHYGNRHRDLSVVTGAVTLSLDFTTAFDDSYPFVLPPSLHERENIAVPSFVPTTEPYRVLQSTRRES